jgi:hypothetical protein
MNSTETPRFETMTTGGLLDRAFRLYTANFPLMVGITAVAYVPLYAVQLFMQAGGQIASRNLMTIMTILFGFILALLWISLTFPIAAGAATYAISERYLGNEVTVGEALSRAFKRLWTLSMAQLEVGLRVMLGILLLIIPGILWWLSYSLAVPVVMVEGQKAGPSVKRSRELVKGNRKKVFVVLMVVTMLQWLVGFGVGKLLQMVLDAQSPSGALISTALGGITQILLAPLAIIAAILLYYDFRIRKEGFDLEMLSRELAPAAESAGISPAALSR